MFQCLNQIWLDCIFQKCSHGTGCLQIICCHRISIKIISDNNSSQTLLKISKIICKAENCHNLGGDCNNKMIFSYHSVGLSSKTNYNIPQDTVIHVHAAFPHDLTWIDPQGIPLLDMIIKHCCQQIVGRSDGMKISREMKIQILHRNHL